MLLGEHLRDAGKPGTKDRVYPYDKPSGVGQFVGGSSAPRPYNPEALREAAERERDEDLPIAERVRARIREEARAVMAGLRANAPEELKDPEVRQAIRQTYSRRQAVDVMRAEASRDVDSGEPYHREALRREIKLLRSWGAVNADDVAAVLRIVEKGSYDEVDAVRDELKQAFDELYGSTLRELREAAGVKG